MKTAYKIRDFVTACMIPVSCGLSSVLLMAMLLPVNVAMAQTAKRALSGKVTTGKDNSPLPGASVRIKGTNNGAITDANGSFNLQVSDSDSLEVTLVGFTKQVISARGKTSLTVNLSEGATGLDEIVVVGYGTEKKKLVTGAIDHVNTQQLEQNHALRVDQALQGQTPGVQITATSAQPGEGMKVRIRGTSTVGNADPLYIVDGVPTSDISYLNASDIAAMDVLKDAASSAIYGARAANGVVLVTTRKGRAGNMKMSYDSYYGIQNPSHKVSVLNAHDYGVIMNEMAINSGSVPYFTMDQLSKLGKGTDWQEAIYNKKAPMQNHSLGFAGGNETSVFSSSVAYTKQDGVVGLKDQSQYDRLSFRMNSEHKMYKDIVIFGENVTYTQSRKRGVGVGNIYANALRSAFTVSPLFPVYNPDGSYAKSTFNVQEANPVAVMDYQNQNKSKTDRIMGNTYLQVSPVKGLTLRTDFGIDVSNNDARSYTPIYDLSTNVVNEHSRATQGIYRTHTWNWDNTINYQRDFGKHNIGVLVGMNSNETKTSYLYGYKQDLTKEGLDNAVIDNGTTDSTQRIFGADSSATLYSYFGRISYSYADKYMFTAVVRSDASSRFGPNNRRGTFPSFSIGWVPTNEDFFKLSWLDFLKVRAGWGQNGNLPTGYYQYLSTISTQYLGYYFGSGDLPFIGAAPVKISNPDLKWETSEQANVGIDATLFRDFNLTVDVYRKTTKDWLVPVNVPAVSGASTVLINGGNVRNQGVEVSLGYSHTFHDLTVGVNGNIGVNRNEITDIPNREKIINGSGGITYASMPEFYRAQVGFPMGYFYGYKTAGIFQNENEVAAYVSKDGKKIQPNALPGDVRFQDLNGDGVIDSKDETQIGNPYPKFTYGLNFNLGYKGFDFSASLYGNYGNQIWDGTHDFSSPLSNYSTEILGRWTGEGTSNRIPRVTDGAELNQNWIRSSDLYVHNASFLRVKSLNLGYDFKKVLHTLPLQQLRLYVSATNLFTFTPYKGVDPEVGYGPTGWASGIDLGTYPQPKTVLVGLNVKF
ncbi:SusC/RagA family TonB-linked outer membrane protein [Chitinophaga filiformis]|uniref:TonB-linked outer membrane protein, SusC/RagA family n=1 Tax=Chitinophaga filiformis TaxID=104663 RepID=A0A1G8CGE0_CHIFI|nr:TonB-dependent receptor [Chitinophaga filiformis]SDH44458.1 TonB-linked outer membrane protein, SusC/RagA family [Chitinophaga filiformis]